MMEDALPSHGALLEVAGLEVDLPGRNGMTAILKGISFELHAGETVSLVGQSGSGKSVTALALMRLLPPRARLRGRIAFAGRNLPDLPEREMRGLRGNRIGMVFQEPMSSLNPLFTIGEQMREAVLFHAAAKDRGKARARALELLELVRLPEAARRFDSYPHELSGGQLQRIMIGMALANDPDLLIADEPTTALDVTIQAQILGLLRDLRQRLGLALLLITHDFGIVREMSDRVCVMHAGEIVESGPVETVFARPQSLHTRALLASSPGERAAGGPVHRDVVLEARDVVVDYTLRTGLLGSQRLFRAVDGISLQVRSGQTMGIVGESGSGKSTLGRAILGLVPHQGQVSFEGAELGSLRPEALRALRQRMQIVFQDPFGSLSPRLRVAEIVGEGLRIHRPSIGRAERDRLIGEALLEVGLSPDLRFRYPHEFSGGQRQRIAIARAMVLRPKLLVLDEPTSALDRSVQLQIISLLQELQAAHELAYIFISHDLAIIRAVADEVIVMKDGRVVEAGMARQVFDCPEAGYTQSLLRASFHFVAS